MVFHILAKLPLRATANGGGGLSARAHTIDGSDLLRRAVAQPTLISRAAGRAWLVYLPPTRRRLRMDSNVAATLAVSQPTCFNEVPRMYRAVRPARCRGDGTARHWHIEQSTRWCSLGGCGEVECMDRRRVAAYVCCLSFGICSVLIRGHVSRQRACKDARRAGFPPIARGKGEVLSL